MVSFYFAHNGIDHANHVEAAAHSSSPLLVLAITALIVIVAALAISRRNRPADEPEESEDE